MSNGYNDRPISPWGYIGYEFLFGIPLVGCIIALILSFASGNQNVKNFARAQFCVVLLIIILVVVASLLGVEFSF